MMFEDEFLDDQDLLAEHPLSDEDAGKLYDRGETTREPLSEYWDRLRNRQQAKQEPSNWVKLAFVILTLG